MGVSGIAQRVAGIGADLSRTTTPATAVAQATRATTSTGATNAARDGALQVAVLGEHANPSVHNIAGALQARGAVAHIIDLADVRTVNGRLFHRDLPMPKLDAAIGYHGAEVPTGGLKMMRAMERDGVAFVNNARSIQVSRDKWLTADALQAAGVRTPKTVLVKSGDEAREAVAELGTPIIVKLRVGTEGKGVAKISNANEVAPIVDLMSASKRNAVLQQMVRMEEPADIRAFVVNGKVVASMERRVGASKTGDFRTNVSNGGTALPITLHPDDELTAIASAKATGLDVAGVDLMGNRGSMSTIEANSGPGQKIIGVTGVDVADAIAAHAIDTAAAGRAARAGA